MQIEDKIILNQLYDIYYELFTKKQQQIYELYIEDDFSKSEIAETLKVSKPYITKIIKEINTKLVYYEEILMIQTNYQKNIKILTDNQIDEKIIKKIR